MTSILPDWNLSKISLELFKKEYTGEILAWKIMEDERPLFIESFIAFFTYNKQWMFAHLYRHPKSSIPHHTLWEVSHICDVPYVGSDVFNHKPTQKDLLKFLDETQWSFTEEDKWTIHNIGINKEAWAALMGEEPPTQFFEEIEKIKSDSNNPKVIDENTNTFLKKLLSGIYAKIIR